MSVGDQSKGLSKDDEITLLIQGPLHAIRTLQNARLNVDNFSRIVISTWEPQDGDSISIFSDLLKLSHSIEEGRITVVTAPLPALNKTAYNPANLLLQLQSTLTGLNVAKSNHVVKCRSDEVYNLKQFKATYFIEPRKPLFANFIVRETSYARFHMSDHLFAAELTDLKSALSTLKEALEGGCRSDKLARFIATHPPPEVLITVFILIQLGIETETVLNAEQAVAFQIIKNHLRLFDLTELGPYVLSANHAGFKELTDLPKLAKSWNPRNTLGLRHFRTIDEMGPETWIRRALRNLNYRIAHQVGFLFNNSTGKTPR